MYIYSFYTAIICQYYCRNFSNFHILLIFSFCASNHKLLFFQYIVLNNKYLSMYYRYYIEFCIFYTTIFAVAQYNRVFVIIFYRTILT